MFVIHFQKRGNASIELSKRFYTDDELENLEFYRVSTKTGGLKVSAFTILFQYIHKIFNTFSTEKFNLFQYLHLKKLEKFRKFEFSLAL